jgi:hypothetical protein
MTPAAMLRRIRELAAKDSNVRFTYHARSRMDERGILIRQVMTVLRMGVVAEGPSLNIRGNWQCTLRRLAAGVEVYVAVALEDGVLIITVY